MQAAFEHNPVLLEQATEYLGVFPGGRYCDGTLGGAGHTTRILEQSGPDGVVLGIDRDPDAVAHCRSLLAGFGSRATVVQGNFADVVSILEQHDLVPVGGILLDLGVSSHQLDWGERGFSFRLDGPLDMRMNPEDSSVLPAAQLIAQLDEKELARVLYEYGEEPQSRRLARAIKIAQQRGELSDTKALAAVVLGAVGQRREQRINPATRTFQALRIAVNDELGALDRFLASFLEALKPGGRVVIISFHSLEDRRVKQGFARLANPCTCPTDLPVCGCQAQPLLSVLTKKPVRCSDPEQARNPRARSARLRAAEKL